MAILGSISAQYIREPADNRESMSDDNDGRISQSNGHLCAWIEAEPLHRDHPP